MAFSPDGRRLATGDEDGLIRIWDGQTQAELVQIRGHKAQVSSLAWSPDGTRLVSGSADGTGRIWW